MRSEPLRDGSGQLAGSVTRAQYEINGAVEHSTEPVGTGTFKVSLEVANETVAGGDPRDRKAALLRSMLSAHMILSVEGGEFVSLLEPPDEFREFAASCRNVGNFPVLLGDAGARDRLLCSPILLYDYPQVAPESVGDFFDGTEIDEMLTLRVITLTEKEKNEMCSADFRTEELLRRTEETAREQLMKTHGTMRNLRRVSGDE